MTMTFVDVPYSSTTMQPTQKFEWDQYNFILDRDWNPDLEDDARLNKTIEPPASDDGAQWRTKA